MIKTTGILVRRKYQESLDNETGMKDERGQSCEKAGYGVSSDAVNLTLRDWRPSRQLGKASGGGGTKEYTVMPSNHTRYTLLKDKKDTERVTYKIVYNTNSARRRC